MIRCSSLLDMTKSITTVCKSATAFAGNRNFTSSSNALQLSREDKWTSPFRCIENDPTKHTMNHEGQFYEVPTDDYKRLFTFGGILRDHQRKVKSFNECCLMARSPALEIMDYLRKANYGFPINKYVLYGVNGAGKTMSLAHLIHFCYKHGWLILHVPWAPLYIRFPKEVVPSSYKENRVDLPYYSVSWLQQFKTQNFAILNSIQPSISQTYTWSKRETNEKDTPLTDIIEHGINRIKFSSDCVGAVLKEVKQMASSGLFKVLVVIDGVNAFFNTTRLKRDDHTIIPADDISLIHNFKKLMMSDWRNGAVIATVDILATHSSNRESILPRYLLGKEGFELLEPFVPVEVPIYSLKEINSCLDYYIDRRWIQSEQGKSSAGREQLIFLSGYNPMKLMEFCGPW